MWVRHDSRLRVRKGGAVADRDRGDETVTLSRARFQKAATVPPVAKRAPEGGDLEFQIPFDDTGRGPDAGEQLFLADELAGSLDARDQDFRCPAADADRGVSVEQ